MKEPKIYDLVRYGQSNVIGSHFFDNDDNGNAVIVNLERCIKMINNFSSYSHPTCVILTG